MTQTITENIYASVTHNISQKSTAKNAKTKAVLNQAVADLSKAASIVHQVHWYMRGAGFYYLHPKMDELMDGLNASLDEMSERLITIGGAPYSTLKEFDENSKLDETTGSFDKTMDEHLARLVDVYTYLSALTKLGLMLLTKKVTHLLTIFSQLPKQTLKRQSGCFMPNADKHQESNNFQNR